MQVSSPLVSVTPGSVRARAIDVLVRVAALLFPQNLSNVGQLAKIEMLVSYHVMVEGQNQAPPAP